MTKTPVSSFLQIDPRVRNIIDVRSPACRRLSYVSDDETTADVSIIVTFTDYEFYDLKNTLGSLIAVEGGAEGGDWQLIKEILVVDDATSLDYILEEARTFVKDIPRARLLRGPHVEPAGIAKSRAVALKEVPHNIVLL